MLAAAHVLAMDAKNLLDVVDCIRERYPHIDWRAALALANLSPTIHPQNQILTQNNIPECQTLTPQNPDPQEEIKPDFKINQPVTTVPTVTEHQKEHNSLPITSNRVSTIIHNYNLYGNVREPHIYGNEGVFQHSHSVDDSKIDTAPIESVKSRVQAISGKIDSPPIYSISKKMVPIDQNDQG